MTPLSKIRWIALGTAALVLGGLVIYARSPRVVFERYSGWSLPDGASDVRVEVWRSPVETIVYCRFRLDRHSASEFQRDHMRVHAFQNTEIKGFFLWFPPPSWIESHEDHSADYYFSCSTDPAIREHDEVFFYDEEAEWMDVAVFPDYSTGIPGPTLLDRFRTWIRRLF